MSTSTVQFSRREFLAVATAAGFVRYPGQARSSTAGTDPSTLPPYGNGTLPPGIRSRTVANVNGLTVHMLEAGYERPGRPAVLLLHGFPELAYSWRKVMLPLAAAGYHVIAPDQRGYGRTTGWDDSYDADPDPFRILNMVRDAIGLVYALGHRSVAMVVGHDAGRAGRVLVRAHPARHLPFGDDHELAVRRRAVAAVRHRQRRRRRRARHPPTTSSTRSSRSSTLRGSTTRTISAHAAPTTTCSMRRKASTRSFAPTTTTRAPTGKGTNRIP